MGSKKRRGIGTQIVDIVSVPIIHGVSAPARAIGGVTGTIANQFTPLAAVGTLKRLGDDIEAITPKKKLKRLI